MEELDGHVAAMAWDWDASNIDADEDDSKLWVPMTPQTMRMTETPSPGWVGPPMFPMKPPWQMAVYALQLS